MKTEKQIFLLSKEMGEQRIKETEPVDEIIVEKENYNTWAEKTKQSVPLNFMPPIYKGCFVFNDDTYTGRLYFECNFNEDGTAEYTLTSIYQPKNNGDYWDFDCTLTVENALNAKLDKVWVDNYEDADILIMSKQKKPESQVIDYMRQNVIRKTEGPVMTFLMTCARINYLMEHPEEKEFDTPRRKVSRRGESKSSDGSRISKTETEKTENNSADNVRRTINLNRITINTHSPKTARQIKSRRRVTISWSVRGHIRHYKNGKTVYIKPFEKGQGRKIKKSYEI